MQQSDPPRAGVAAVTLVGLAKKAGEVTILGFKDILIDILSKQALDVLRAGLHW